MKLVVSVLMCLLVAMPLAAQYNMPKADLNPYKVSGSSILDLNRIAMSHSMGFSAGTSSGGSGYYLSRYTNHLKYSFNPKLEMELDLNFVNFGSTSSSFKPNDDNKSKILPEFKLSYRPSDSVHLQIELRQGNHWMSDDTPWYNRW